MLYNFNSLKAERTFKSLPSFAFFFNILETVDHILHLVVVL